MQLYYEGRELVVKFDAKVTLLVWGPFWTTLIKIWLPFWLTKVLWNNLVPKTLYPNRFLSNIFGLRSFLYYYDKKQVAFWWSILLLYNSFLSMLLYYESRQLEVLLVVHFESRRYYGTMCCLNKTFGDRFWSNKIKSCWSFWCSILK